MMKRLISAVVLLGAGVEGFAQSDIDPDHKFAWGENIGWTNWRDAEGGAQGVMIHDTFLSGYVWGENVGWINFGDGDPGDDGGTETEYANETGADFGVNLDPDTGELSGYAWGENIGWINFSGGALAEPTTEFPDPTARLDLADCRFHGFAWGENVGWINLDDEEHYVAPAGAVVALSEDFSATPDDWTLLGDTAYEAGFGLLRLVHSGMDFVAGDAFRNDLGLITDAFEMEFDFQMTNPAGGVPDDAGDPDPDGLAFIVTSAPVTEPGFNGYGLGYQGFPADSFAVEFDTFDNFVSGQPDDPDGNHVGIDVAGSMTSIATTFVATDFDETGIWHVRIRFFDDQLTVFLTPPGGTEDEVIVQDIPEVNVPEVKFLGFGAGTGANSADTDIDNVMVTLLDNDRNGDGLPDRCMGCEGDANGDGVVDPLDSGFVLARFGCDVGAGDVECDAADQNGDGAVDPLDVGYILARFGNCR